MHCDDLADLIVVLTHASLFADKLKGLVLIFCLGDHS